MSSFTREYNIQKEKIKIHINCYITNNLSVYDIEKYWQQILQMPSTSFTKTTINNISKYSSQKKDKNKLLYGTVQIIVHDVSLVQNIFGAIQAYASFDNEFGIM